MQVVSEAWGEQGGGIEDFRAAWDKNEEVAQAHGGNGCLAGCYPGLL
jgi:hypothetical protein